MTPRMCGAGLAGRRRGSGERGTHRGSTGRGIASPCRREAERDTPRVRTRRAGLAPRPEYEVGTGCRLCGEAAPLREHEQAAVEALAQLDTAADVGAGPRQLHPARPKADSIVVGDDARVAAAEAGGKVAGGGAPGGLGVDGGAGEASGEIGEEGGEEGGGALDGGDAVQAQLGDEAILQGLPEAFDATLGLGGPRGDKADAEVAQDAPEVGRVLCAAELFVERPVGVVTN